MARMHVLRGEVLARDQRPQQVDIGRHAVDAELGQRAAQTPYRVVEARRGGGDDELGQQRVIAGRRGIAGIAVGIHAHVRAAGRIEALEPALRGPRETLGVGGLGIDPQLDGKAARCRRRLRVEPRLAQRAPLGKGKLRRHQIHAGHLLGDRVLHLETRVGFDKDEAARLAGLRGLHEELERPKAAVAHLARHHRGGMEDTLAQARREYRARRDLDQLLEAPLQRAVALAQRHHVAPIANDLYFDVARAFHQPFRVDLVHAEGAARLGTAARVGFREPLRLPHDAHAAPTTAAHGLQHDPVAVLGVEERGDGVEGGPARRGRHDRHVALRRQRQRASLVAEQPELLGRRADEEDARIRTCLRKVGALAQEAVAGVDRIGAAGARGVEHRVDIEIGRRAATGQRHRFVGQHAVAALGVVGGVDGHRGDAKILGRPLDTQRNLAAICNQKLLHWLDSRG
ncbi:hypothetical protein D3C86_1131560 [compost metagenome]